MKLHCGSALMHPHLSPDMSWDLLLFVISIWAISLGVDTTTIPYPLDDGLVSVNAHVDIATFPFEGRLLAGCCLSRSGFHQRSTGRS